MTKRDFLEKLRMALNGRVTSGQLTENMNYYEDYINTEIRKGRSEEEVLAGLGDPRLIARTIVETEGVGGGRAEEGRFAEGERFSEYGPTEGYQDSAGYADGGAWYGQEDGYGFREPSSRKGFHLMTRIPLWIWLILFLLVVVLILSAVFSVISALLPILLPILGVLLLVKNSGIG